MILTIAACVTLSSLGPVTPAAAAQRRNLANAEAVRVALIDSALNARIVQLVQVDAAMTGGPSGITTGQIMIVDDRGTRTTLGLGTTPGKADSAASGAGALALAPSWWVIDESNGATNDLPAPASGASGASRRPANPGGTAEPTRPARIQLTDGQRLMGHLGSPELDIPADSQLIRWIHPQLGGLTLPLERIRRIELRPGLPAPVGAGSAAPTNSELDEVALVNGDRVEGYIESIVGGGGGGPDAPEGAVTVSREAPGARGPAGSGPTVIAISQVTSIQLGNPAEPARGPVLWLGDASVIAAQRFDIDAANGRVTLNARVPGARGAAAQAGPTSLDLSDLRAIAFDAGRITPLSQLRITGFSPNGSRRIAAAPIIRPVAGDGWPSPLGADDIDLPGPMLAEWELPARAVRLAGWISLDPSARVWGDCEVVLSLVGGDSAAPRELARQRVNAAHAVMPVNVPLPGSAGAVAGGAKLRVTVDPGEHGPIQDRVTLRRMLILTGPDSPTPAPR